MLGKITRTIDTFNIKQGEISSLLVLPPSGGSGLRSIHALRVQCARPAGASN